MHTLDGQWRSGDCKGEADWELMDKSTAREGQGVGGITALGLLLHLPQVLRQLPAIPTAADLWEIFSPLVKPNESKGSTVCVDFFWALRLQGRGCCVSVTICALVRVAPCCVQHCVCVCVQITGRSPTPGSYTRQYKFSLQSSKRKQGPRRSQEVKAECQDGMPECRAKSGAAGGH